MEYDYLTTYPPGSARAHKRRSAERLRQAKLRLPVPKEFVGPVLIRFPDRSRRHCITYDESIKAIRDYMTSVNLLDTKGIEVMRASAADVQVTGPMKDAGARVVEAGLLKGSALHEVVEAVFLAMLGAR